MRERQQARIAHAASGTSVAFHLTRYYCGLAGACLAVALGGCGALTTRPSAPEPPAASRSTPPPSPARPGGYYLDDGPGANPPANLDGIPDAVPKLEPLRRANSRPYEALGTSYRPMAALGPYKARGLATWYGRRYHGKPTASGEIYDMYAMSGAHPILPIPSYVRVTNLQNGRAVVVRINDRGPFIDGRLIDLSYTAAYKLGILGGATMVEVETVIPGRDDDTVVAQADAQTATPEGGAPVVDSVPAATRGRPAPDIPPRDAARAQPAEGSSPPAGGGAPVRPVQVAAIPEPPRSLPATSSPAAAPPAIATAAAPAADSTTGTAPARSGNVFVQLGAFASRANADGFLTRLRSLVDWLPLQIYSRDGLHRVQAGPYVSRSDARHAADRLGELLGISAILLTR